VQPIVRPNRQRSTSLVTTAGLVIAPSDPPLCRASRARLLSGSGGDAVCPIWARVRLRVGIIAVRSPQPSSTTTPGTVSSPVGAHKLGNNSTEPGVVTYVSPDGGLQMAPSRSFWSRQPRKVLSRWWDRFGEERSKSAAVCVDARRTR
jgi:hypothetical protein